MRPGSRRKKQRKAKNSASILQRLRFNPTKIPITRGKKQRKRQNGELSIDSAKFTVKSNQNPDRYNV
ncbi:hypothetical protein SO802_006466 [Lithocarpus litseifolius]|uniref:Ribosomal protein S18 n=1 Tax=Lithocarpus litseifolius TaxID=425828 RepID=A0AAW2DL24_9ROSI